MRKNKELIISLVIIAVIVILNVITQNYTKESVDVVSEKLENLREKIIREDVDKNSSKEQISDIMEDWRDRFQRLAYFIEHDELEKVETELTSLKANIEMEKYEEAVPDLDKTIFILNHIKNKFTLEIRNIF